LPCHVMNAGAIINLLATGVYCPHPVTDFLPYSSYREIRSVTIWFQNKRQTDRRGRVATGKSSRQILGSPFSASSGKTIHTARASSTNDMEAETPTETSPVADDALSLPDRCLDDEVLRTPQSNQCPRILTRGLSLDHIAARSERSHAPLTPPRRVDLFPRTPPRVRSETLWDNMPSSSPVPAVEPQADHDLLTFGRRRLKRMRTLEWACAAARVGGQTVKGETEPDSEDVLMLDLGGDTEDECEAHEAVTPKNGQSLRVRRRGRRWVEADKENTPIAKENDIWKSGAEKLDSMHDDDMMNAALALCGLGRRT